MTTARLSSYEVVTAPQDVDAMIVERPGLAPLLALRDGSSRSALIAAVRAIAPFADEDEVRSVVLANAPDAPRDIEDSLADAEGHGPPDLHPHLPVMVGALVLCSLLACAAVVLAHVAGLREQVDDLRAQINHSQRADLEPNPAHVPDGTRPKVNLSARDYRQLRRQI
ncbi:MAG TPA: hypothetical protein VGF17_05125, partial [Phytomonospora sp.]